MTLLRITTGEAGRITVAVPYDPTFVVTSHGMTGRRRHREDTVWRVPRPTDGLVPQVFDHFAGEQIAVLSREEGDRTRHQKGR